LRFEGVFTIEIFYFKFFNPHDSYVVLLAKLSIFSQRAKKKQAKTPYLIEMIWLCAKE